MYENNAESLASPITPIDFFTNMPEDCIINIFKLLDRDSLDNVERVNRQMHTIANSAMFRSVKRYYKDLIIATEEPDNDHVLVACKSNTVYKELKFGGLRKRKYDNVTGQIDYAVPTKVFCQTKKFLVRNNVEAVNLIRVCIDRRVVDDCARTFRYHRDRVVSLMSIRRSHFAPSMTDSDRRYVIRTLMTIGISIFVFEDCDIDTMIDESVIAALAVVPRRHDRRLHIIKESESRQKMNRIFAKKEIISSIEQFDVFVANFITLKTEWIFELAEKVFSHKEVEKEWNFTVTSRNISEYQGSISPESTLVILDVSRYQLIHLTTGNCAHISFGTTIDDVYKLNIKFTSGDKAPEPLCSLFKRSRQ